jgi:hypothetical protein
MSLSSQCPIILVSNNTHVWLESPLPPLPTDSECRYCSVALSHAVPRHVAPLCHKPSPPPSVPSLSFPLRLCLLLRRVNIMSVRGTRQPQLDECDGRPRRPFPLPLRGHGRPHGRKLGAQESSVTQEESLVLVSTLSCPCVHVYGSCRVWVRETHGLARVDCLCVCMSVCSSSSTVHVIYAWSREAQYSAYEGTERANATHRFAPTASPLLLRLPLVRLRARARACVPCACKRLHLSRCWDSACWTSFTYLPRQVPPPARASTAHNQAHTAD